MQWFKCHKVTKKIIRKEVSLSYLLCLISIFFGVLRRRNISIFRIRFIIVCCRSFRRIRLSRWRWRIVFIGFFRASSRKNIRAKDKKNINQQRLIIYGKVQRKVLRPPRLRNSLLLGKRYQLQWDRSQNMIFTTSSSQLITLLYWGYWQNGQNPLKKISSTLKRA